MRYVNRNPGEVTTHDVYVMQDPSFPALVDVLREKLQ